MEKSTKWEIAGGAFAVSCCVSLSLGLAEWGGIFGLLLVVACLMGCILCFNQAVKTK